MQQNTIAAAAPPSRDRRRASAVAPGGRRSPQPEATPRRRAGPRRRGRRCQRTARGGTTTRTEPPARCRPPIRPDPDPEEPVTTTRMAIVSVARRLGPRRLLRGAKITRASGTRRLPALYDSTPRGAPSRCSSISPSSRADPPTIAGTPPDPAHLPGRLPRRPGAARLRGRRGRRPHRLGDDRRRRAGQSHAAALGRGVALRLAGEAPGVLRLPVVRRALLLDRRGRPRPAPPLALLGVAVPSAAARAWKGGSAGQPGQPFSEHPQARHSASRPQ